MQNDLFDPRLTEKRNPSTAHIDRASSIEIVDLIYQEDRAVPEAVHAEREAIARAIEIAVECFTAGGRLIYVGAGTSGRLGVLDATECPPTFGTDPEQVQGIIAGGLPALTRSQEGSEDQPQAGAAALDEKGVGPNDFVFGIATSSTTPYVRGALKRAVELGARTGFLCCTEPEDEMRAMVDVCVVPLVGPEVIAGSTRMKAGTATKLILNTITTGSMIRLGKVYGNLMVDLQAMSDKLVDRSQRIVMAATDLGREEALAAIERAEGSVKTAIVMAGAGSGLDLARLYLAEAGGFVSEALELAEAAELREGRMENPFIHYPLAPPNDEATQAARGALGSLPRRLSTMLDGVPDERLRSRPAEDKWSVKEQIDHLIDVDELMASRIGAILTEDNPHIANRDDEAENQKSFERGARESQIDLLLKRLERGRAKLVDLVGDGNGERLARTGEHELLGTISGYQILRHLLWHDDHHLKIIQELLGE